MMTQIQSIAINMILAILVLAQMAMAERSSSPLSFLVMADQHLFAPFSFGVNTTEYIETWNSSLNVLKSIKSDYGGDLILMSGDSASYGKMSNMEIFNNLGPTPETEINDAIYHAGFNCYRTQKELFLQSGWNTILAALGDHEIGGNQGFRMSGNNSKYITIPSYRRAFGDGFNKDDDNEFLFPHTIGEVNSRPIGTTYEDTSFAYIHKNTLFVTIDAFLDKGKNYLDKENGFGGEGAIACEVSGNHLIWFESVLAEVKKDSNIKHIIVQAHLPILLPVRKVRSSGQFMDGAENSEFWKIMEKYGVDIYLAGEVHSNTASQLNRSGSNVVQIVSRGNFFSNFLKVSITDDMIDVILFNEKGEKPMFNGKYEEKGRLTIDKKIAPGNILVSSSGDLELINRSPSSPLIHFDFEEMFSIESRKVCYYCNIIRRK